MGGASLFTDSGLATIANVSTRPEHQKEGIATLLSLWSLHSARNEGYKVASLSASCEGTPVYTKLGFQEIGKSPVYIIPPEKP